MGRPVVDGFTFDSARETEKAKKEYESIKKLKNKINIEDIEETKKLYNKLVQKRYLETPVGLSFLHEMREYLLQHVPEEELNPIFVPDYKVKTPEKSSIISSKFVRLEEENKKLHSLKNKMAIAITALVIIVVGMIFIVMTNENLGYFNAEEKVLDKYAAWQERLQNWEEELIEREDALKNSNN